MKISRTLLLLVLVAAVRVAAVEPLILTNGEPLTCIYFFPHWWEPWKSDDQAVLRDLQRLRDIGINTLLVDHEWSQAIDGHWRWLDRTFDLAAKANLQVVPWLSLKTWSDVHAGDRERLAQQQFGVKLRYGMTQDGAPTAPLIYDDSVIQLGAKYAEVYLDRYLKRPLLRLRWNGKERPVISLGVESAWEGSFDDGTNLLFTRWLRSLYRDISALNHAWGTRYAGFEEVDSRDKTVFDYAGYMKGQAKHAAAAEDHVAFRAQTISDAQARIGALVRRKHPDVLLMAEVPYQYGSEHPDARSYRIWFGANPESCDWGDIVLFRNTGPLNSNEIRTLESHQKRTGQKFILAYRTYGGWSIPGTSPQLQTLVQDHADQVAKYASGLGFYSWNEMGDCHVAYSPAVDCHAFWGVRDQAAEMPAATRATELMQAMVKRYLQKVGSNTTAPEYLIGVYYFSGWSRQLPDRWVIQGRDWRKEWPGRVPLLGEYNEQPTMDREIAAAADHGVHFFQILWYPAGPSPEEWSADPLNAGLRQFLASTNRHRLKFTLEYVNHPPFDLKADDEWRNACREWAVAMKDPAYLRVGGRPIFKIHGLQHFLNQNGKDTQRVAARIRTLRDVARESGLPDPLIGGGVVPSEVDTIAAAAGPCDFLTTYMDMPGLPKVEKPYSYSPLLAHAEQAWKRYAEKSPRPYVPYLPAGWDPRPWKDPRPSFDLPTRDEWKSALQKIKAALDNTPNLGVRLSPTQRQKMLLVYAWNEFGEGGIVAPTRGDGTMKLEAIRQVFGPGAAILSGQQLK